MTRKRLALITVAGLTLSGGAFLSCAETKTHESTGEYIDNSVITTKVKTAILQEPSLKTLQISVKTYRTRSS